MKFLRRVGRDLRNRRHVEVYVVAAASIVLAVGSLAGDLVSDDVRWATVLAALGLLTYQVTTPGRSGDLDDVLHDRTSFEDVTIGSRLRGAKEVWIQAPSAVNLLTADVAEMLRTTILSRGEGVVRVMVLDPSAAHAVELAARQLDDATAYKAVELPQAVHATADRLEKMAAWTVAGSFEYRHMAFNPGFSLVAIDPHGKDGLLIVEFHGVNNESTASRMHIELTRTTSERWYVYWRDQFEHLWQTSRPPQATASPARQMPGG